MVRFHGRDPKAWVKKTAASTMVSLLMTGQVVDAQARVQLGDGAMGRSGLGMPGGVNLVSFASWLWMRPCFS
jgi:hypothetical protein